MPRYVPLQGRANNYRVYDNPPSEASIRAKTSARSVTNSEDATRIAARLTTTDVARRAGISQADTLEILTALELNDACFSDKVLVLIHKEEAKRNRRFERQQLLI